MRRRGVPRGSLCGWRLAEQATFPAEGDAVHFRFACEDGGLAAEVREEVAQSEGFEFVVHLAVAGAGARGR